ncbi:hypothetical protein HYW76_02235 [Candidatus Pacearchaeota archaeon]|nr:hypothetical protein [Candidatus Pacearchaeota archaeon]
METSIIILILLSAFPAGYFLAYLTKEEIVAGRKWFIYLSVICFISAFIAALSSIEIKLKLAVILSLFYIIIVSMISVYLSWNTKFVKKN